MRMNELNARRARPLRLLVTSLVPLVLSSCAHGSEPRDAHPDAPSSAPATDPAGAPVVESASIAPAEPTSSVAQPTSPSLYDRIGGLPAIEAVVTEFRRNVAADEAINHTFGLTDMPTLHRHLVEFFCAATGGPCKYTGRSMQATHKNLGLTSAHFDALVRDLVKTLDTFKVPEREKGEILGALGPMKKDIVEVE